MSSIEADPLPDLPLAGTLTVTRKLSPVRVWALALTAGLIAGFASWQIGETYHGRFVPELIPTKRTGSHEVVNANFIARQAADTKEATLAFGALGAVLGLALGLAGGAARGCARSALIAAIVGSILGGAAGAGLTWVLLPIYFRNVTPGSSDLILAMLLERGSWSLIGAAGGAAFGIGIGDRRRALGAIFGGLLGAIAGVVVYELVGGIAFPIDGISDPLSDTSGTRLLARLAVTTLAAAGTAWGALDRVKEAIPKPVTAADHS